MACRKNERPRTYVILPQIAPSPILDYRFRLNGYSFIHCFHLCCAILRFIGDVVNSHLLFYFTVTAKTKSKCPDQHCEMPGCTDEVWAACSVGTCLTLLCYEHFNGNLSNVHELSCKGRCHRPRDLVLINPDVTMLSDPTTTAILAEANNQQQP